MPVVVPGGGSNMNREKIIISGRGYTPSGQAKDVGPYDYPVDSEGNGLLTLTSILRKSGEQFGTSYMPGGSDLTDGTGPDLAAALLRGASGLLGSAEYLDPGATGGLHQIGHDSIEGRYAQFFELPAQTGVGVYWRGSGIDTGDHFTFESYPTFRVKLEPVIPTDEIGLFVGLYSNGVPDESLTTAAPTPAVAGLQFDNDEGDVNYQFVYGSGGGATRIDTGVAPTAGEAVWFEITAVGFTPSDLRFCLLDRDLNMIARHAPTAGTPPIATNLAATCFFKNRGADAVTADGIRFYQAWLTLGQSASY